MKRNDARQFGTIDNGAHFFFGDSSEHRWRKDGQFAVDAAGVRKFVRADRMVFMPWRIVTELTPCKVRGAQ